MGLEPASLGPLTLSDMNISETSWQIIIKFHLKHHWGGGLAALDFGPDRIRTLVSMETDSSHRVIMGENLVSTLALPFFIGSSLYLQVTRTAIKAWMGSKFVNMGSGSLDRVPTVREKSVKNEKVQGQGKVREF